MKLRPTPLWMLLHRLARSVVEHGIAGAAVRSYRRLSRSFRNHGLSGTFDRAFRHAPPPAPTIIPQHTHPFDLLHGTDTGGYIPGEKLVSVSFSGLYSTAYLPIAPSTFRAAMGELSIPHEEFT